MIRSFRCRETEKVFGGQHSRKFPRAIQASALRKLQQIHISEKIEDLRAPPGNRFEALKGKRAGFHSVRVNDQWRVCFRWKDGDAYEVEIIDYH